MSTRAIAAACLVGLCLASGCAQARSTAAYHSLGVVDVARDARTVAQWEETRRGDAPADVRVYVAALPDGLTVDSGTLEVEEGRAHRILGRFRLAPTRHQYGTVGFSEYEDPMAAALCYPQVLLTWATLGLWVAVPTSWACLSDPFQPREALIDQARHLAAAAGGDAVVGMFEDADGSGEATAFTGVVLDLEQGTNGSTPYTGPATNFLDGEAFGPKWATGATDED